MRPVYREINFSLNRLVKITKSLHFTRVQPNDVYIPYRPNSKTPYDSFPKHIFLIRIYIYIIGWWQYDERTCFDIEEAYKKGEKFCTILVAGYVYVVDFESMLQQRQNDPSRKRQVKRDLASTPKKGVAGLRTDGSTDQVPSGESTPDSGAAASSTNLISTIVATDAAIRIASDIIDSTLAHADEYRLSAHNLNDTRSLMDGGGAVSPSSIRSNASSSSSGSSIEFTRQELLDEVEETLNISNRSSICSQPNLEELFSSAIDGVRSLALNNIADSDSDTDDDNEL